MNCPHCGGEISPAAILGKEGGKKSRRTLTTEQSKAMIEAREAKRKVVTANPGDTLQLDNIQSITYLGK